jgi:RNA polymerase sigma-70 factor (ECF subfamily)
MKEDNNPSDHQGSNTQPEMFLKLLLSNEIRIYSYILTLVPNYTNADEIMQDTSGIMWRKFHEFQPGTDFVSWGIRIAHYRILDFRRRQSKEKIIYDNDLFERIAPVTEEKNQHMNKRIDALRHCLAKLKERQLKLIQLRYGEGIKPKDISGRLGLSIHNIYKSLSRIHGQLSLCVKKVLAMEGITS